MHLIIDGFGKNKNILQDEDFIYQLLDKYPARIGMTKITGPIVFRYSGKKPDEWGVSGLVFIAESHIGLHTFVDKNFINIDIFSCKDFDARQAMQDMKETFELIKMRSSLVRRDWEPADIEECHELLEINSI